MTAATRRFPLTPGDAVAAIILTPDQRFVMQRRDPLPHIWYPGAWGLFGGGIDPGETEREALLREIKEELDIEVADVTRFTRFQFDFSFAGGTAVSRAFFEVHLDAVQVSQMRLLEGAALGIMTVDEVLSLAGVVGYDQFALYLYIHRQRIDGRRQSG
jgi:8-oxo-dGTP pyrophosphatase MutT (NUDIX family)